MKNKEICIIEVADECTDDKFDAEQGRQLREWVSKGNVLWANNSVLSIFNIHHSTAHYYGDCRPAGGSHPILDGTKRVRLTTEYEDRGYILGDPDVIPLLASEEKGWGRVPIGTTIWSLVPYGKGWISDPKPIDKEKGDGGALLGQILSVLPP